jgi:hypothetical protein
MSHKKVSIDLLFLQHNSRRWRSDGSYSATIQLGEDMEGEPAPHLLPTVHKTAPRIISVPGTSYSLPSRYTLAYTLNGMEEVERYVLAKRVFLFPSQSVGSAKRFFRCPRRGAKTPLQRCKFKVCILQSVQGNFLVYENEEHNHPYIPPQRRHHIEITSLPLPIAQHKYPSVSHSFIPLCPKEEDVIVLSDSEEDVKIRTTSGFSLLEEGHIQELDEMAREQNLKLVCKAQT